MIVKKFYESERNRDVISFFSGAMGLDIGLTQSGLNIKVCQDYDNDCVESIRSNGHNVVGGDIRHIEPQTMLDVSNEKRGEPFLVCGGPPCQPFSTAGKRLAINDPRGSLFMDFIRMISYIQPRFFIMENVKGLISANVKHLPISEYTDLREIAEEKSGSVFEIVQEQFQMLGYKIVYGLLDAVNYGVPQFRERLVIIGSRDNENIFLPMPTHFQVHQERDYLWRTLGDAIKDLENTIGDCASFSKERLELLKLVPEGGNWKSLPSSIVKEAMGGAYESGGGKVGFYRRLTYNEPSPTLVTSPVQKASMLCHPRLNRPLSIKEYARIQQFPDDWFFAGTISSRYRQIGNAVPVGFGSAIGKALLAVANGDEMIQTKRTRGTDVHNRIQNALMKQVSGNANKQELQ